MGSKKRCSAITSLQSGIFGDYAAEMIFFLFKIAESMLEPTVRLFIYEGICLQELDSHHRCKYLDRYPEDEVVVQTRTASYLMYYKFLLNIPAIFMVLFCGAWSDRSGRKLPVMLTCFGAIVAVLLFMMSSQIGGGKGPFLPMILVGAAIRGSFGRSAVMTMACHSYVSDISTKSCRTRKLAYLVAMSHFGYLVGCTVAGTLIDTTGFVVVFCVVVFIQAICFLVASVCMRSKVSCSVADATCDKNNDKTVDREDSTELVENSACSSFCKIKQLSACFDVIFKPRRGKLRCYISILLIGTIIQQTCKSGEMDITLLFVERAPLSWTKSLYSYLLGVDYACLGAMAFFALPILIRCCRLADSTLASIGLVFKIARSLMLSFSTATWMVFTAVAIGGPHSFTFSGIKSMISKLVDEHEIGKTFSVISCLETISNLLGTVIFTNVYTATLSLWSGFGFALEAGMYFTLLLMMSSFACSAVGAEETPLISDATGANRSYGTTQEGEPKLRERRTSTTSEILYSYDLEASGGVDPRV